MKQVGWVER